MLKSVVRDFSGRVGRFLRAERGAVAIVFGLALVPVVGMTGAGIDYGNAQSTRTRLQSAADATALAVNRAIGTMSKAELKKMGRKTLRANLQGIDNYSLDKLRININDNRVDIEISSNVRTSFLGLVGVNEMEVAVKSQSIIGKTSVEVALVVDNSGSMAGSRISSLKEASNNLVSTLFNGQNSSGQVTMGIVPFTASVNVGHVYANASWIDRNGLSPIHHNNISDENKTRFDLFNDMRDVSWKGCVEARPYPLDTNDRTPNKRKPETLYVPLFAPDDPDGRVYSRDDSFLNSYLDDNGGSCTTNRSPVQAEIDKDSKWADSISDRWGDDADKWADWRQALLAYWNSRNGGSNTSNEDQEGAPGVFGAQHRVCKYKNERPDTYKANGTYMGPNRGCDASAITALTNNVSKLEDSIRDMTAYGGTNMHMGVAWGWRILSPSKPFTQGRAYTDEANRKVMILMSDGENFHGDFENINGSWYSAYGYVTEGRLGENVDSKAEMVREMNKRTLETCTNAKAAGVQIYTIAFDISDKDTKKLLADCASNEDAALIAESNAEMIEAFNKIGNELGELRLSR